MADGSEEWRATKDNAELIIALGCRQDVKTLFIKNGISDYQTKNFTLFVASDLNGPWHIIFEGSMNTSKMAVSSTMRKSLMTYF